MKVFASKQFLLLISAPTLREYTQAHVVYPRITVDWSVEPESFASAIHDAVDALDAAMGEVADPAERKAIEADLSHWHDDLRRAHLFRQREQRRRDRHRLRRSVLRRVRRGPDVQQQHRLRVVPLRERRVHCGELH